MIILFLEKGWVWVASAVFPEEGPAKLSLQPVERTLANEVQNAWQEILANSRLPLDRETYDDGKWEHSTLHVDMADKLYPLAIKQCLVNEYDFRVRTHVVEMKD